MSRINILTSLSRVLLTKPQSLLRKISFSKLHLLFYYLFQANDGERAHLNSILLLKTKEHDTSKNQITPEVSPSNNEIPIFDEIDVSIIIPAYNQWSLTRYCLYSIIKSVQTVKYEIILADDFSTDDTINAKRYFPNLTVVRNKNNLGFLLNCNNAAKHAKGRYLVFLNNDTIVHDYWLEALVDKMDKDSQIAICGSKLVFPDGKLQEAGGIIWDDASGWNYGRMDDPAKPEYSYCKEVDYISGASIMIRQSFWNEVDGFDERYVPAYYEDTDLAFEASSRGYKVVFHPHSVVTHFEGQSHGTDENSGTKAYQASNRLKFKQKWQNKLASGHFKNGEHSFQARDKSADKRTILVIDHYVPWFDKDAGSRSTYMYLQYFLELGYNVKFLGDNFSPHQPYTDCLNEMGIEILHGQYYADNWKEWIKINAQYLDVVYLHRPHIAPQYIEFIRKYTTAKIVYQCHDLHHIRVKRDFKNSGDLTLKKEAERLKKVEKEIFNSIDVGLTFSHDEKAILDSYDLTSIIKQIPIFLYDGLQKNTTSFHDRDGILFVGGFNHKPNEEAVIWFVNEIYPQILEKLPRSQFYIAGSNVPTSINALASDNVTILGFISDDQLAQMYQKVTVSILPLLHGAGVKGKLVESMQHQTPVVSTTIGIEGINAESYNILGYDDPDNFAQQLITLVTNEDDWLKTQNCFSKAFSAEFSKTNFKSHCEEIF